MQSCDAGCLQVISLQSLGLLDALCLKATLLVSTRYHRRLIWSRPMTYPKLMALLTWTRCGSLAILTCSTAASVLLVAEETTQHLKQ